MEGEKKVSFPISTSLKFQHPPASISPSFSFLTPARISNDDDDDCGSVVACLPSFLPSFLASQLGDKINGDALSSLGDEESLAFSNVKCMEI